MNTVSRRDFIKTSGVGVLMVSFSMTGSASQNPDYGLRAPKLVAKDQLDSWGLKYTELRVGKKISADVFIDDKSINASAWRLMINPRRKHEH